MGRVSSVYKRTSIFRPINTSAAGGLSSSSGRGCSGWSDNIEVLTQYLGGGYRKPTKKDGEKMRKKAKAIEQSRKLAKKTRKDNKAAIQREYAKMRNAQFLLKYGNVERVSN